MPYFQYLRKKSNCRVATSSSHWHGIIMNYFTIAGSACHLMLANCKAEFHQGFLRRDGEKDIKIPRYAQSYEKSVEIAKDCPKLAAGNN